MNIIKKLFWTMENINDIIPKAKHFAVRNHNKSPPENMLNRINLGWSQCSRLGARCAYIVASDFVKLLLFGISLSPVEG